LFSSLLGVQSSFESLLPRPIDPRQIGARRRFDARRVREFHQEVPVFEAVVRRSIASIVDQRWK